MIQLYAWATPNGRKSSIALEEFGLDWSEFAALKDWYLRIAARAAVQRGFDVPAMGAEIPLPG